MLALELRTEDLAVVVGTGKSQGQRGLWQPSYTGLCYLPTVTTRDCAKEYDRVLSLPANNQVSVSEVLF